MGGNAQHCRTLLGRKTMVTLIRFILLVILLLISGEVN